MTEKKLLQRLRQQIRAEKTHIDWDSRFVKFHNVRHPSERTVPEIQAFLNDRTVHGHVEATR